MIQGLLREHGIPSMLKRGRGFDNPEFLAAGPRQIFVARGRRRGGARSARRGLPATSRPSRRCGRAISRR